MIDALSYGVSARQLLSSKQVPDSGRVCSWRKPRVWPSSWAMMFDSGQPPVSPNELESTLTSRDDRLLLGKNADARYGWPVTIRTLNRTLLFVLVQLASCADTYVKLTFARLSQFAVAVLSAATIVDLLAPKLLLTQ